MWRAANDDDRRAAWVGRPRDASLTGAGRFGDGRRAVFQRF
jgi:hypothetical protein